MSLLFTRHCPATPNFKGTGIISASRVYHEDQRRPPPPPFSLARPFEMHRRRRRQLARARRPLGHAVLTAHAVPHPGTAVRLPPCHTARRSGHSRDCASREADHVHCPALHGKHVPSPGLDLRPSPLPRSSATYRPEVASWSLSAEPASTSHLDREGMTSPLSSFIRGEDSVSSADLPWGTDRYLDPQDWASLSGPQTPRPKPHAAEARAAVGGAGGAARPLIGQRKRKLRLRVVHQAPV